MEGGWRVGVWRVGVGGLEQGGMSLRDAASTERESPQQQQQNYFSHSPKETLQRERARGTEGARATGERNASGLSVS